MPRFSKTLFVFRRDLRLEDNTGLLFALENSEKVIPCFIFTPEQIENNPYLSLRALQFMIESLEDLSESLKKKKGHLYLFYGDPATIIDKLIISLSLDAVAINRDYTPYSAQRDTLIEKVCQKRDIPLLVLDDALLHSPEETLKADGSPYSVFTPFYNNASRSHVASPVPNRYHNYYTQAIATDQGDKLYKKILPTRVDQAPGGRESALKILKKLKTFSHYSKERDFPALDSTTHLSAHLKFATCSAREVYYAVCEKLGPRSDILRSLYWRDFFSSIALYFPHVFQGAFHKKFNALSWDTNKKAFTAWCLGETGFPIVDAGMRELNTTGYMHNRVRMIVGSFLVKDLHINWRWGEKYFATTLIDYDPAINNGNWQWVASTGCDAQPYFRIFNPWNQQEKFDPDCVYIKRWVPELRELPPKILHRWFLQEHHDLCPAYIPPIVDHSVEAKKTLLLYKKAASSHK